MLQKITSLLESISPDLVPLLNPAATENDINKLETAIGMHIPDELKCCLLKHNGQRRSTEDVGVFGGHYYLSTQDIKEEWLRLTEQSTTYNDLKSTTPHATSLKVNTERWYQPGWIPFTCLREFDPIHPQAAGNLCLDMTPNSNGIPGQVISFWEDDPSRLLLAESLGQWLACLNKDISNDKVLTQIHWQSRTSWLSTQRTNASFPFPSEYESIRFKIFGCIPKKKRDSMSFKTKIDYLLDKGILSFSCYKKLTQIIPQLNLIQPEAAQHKYRFQQSKCTSLREVEAHTDTDHEVHASLKLMQKKIRLKKQNPNLETRQELTIQELVDRIKSCRAERYLSEPLLNPGVTDSQIKRFEDYSRLTLPEDYISMLKVHNGDTFDAFSGDTLFQGLDFLPIERVMSEWHELIEFGEDVVGEESEPDDDSIRNDWYNSKWIPITKNSGNNICLDLDPGPSGICGQVITFWCGQPERTVLANSVRDWLHLHLSELEKGCAFGAAPVMEGEDLVDDTYSVSLLQIDLALSEMDGGTNTRDEKIKNAYKNGLLSKSYVDLFDLFLEHGTKKCKGYEPLLTRLL